MADVIAVKRSGPRGWHWISASRYDPAIHELHAPDFASDAETENRSLSTTGLHDATPTEDIAPAPKRRGRPPKQRTE